MIHPCQMIIVELSFKNAFISSFLLVRLIKGAILDGALSLDFDF